MIQVKVSFDRINNFLLDDELKIESLRTIPSHNSDTSVGIQRGKFSWDPELMKPTLGDVNLDVKWGQKCAICGPVGAGKSSLLFAILGEMPKISGTVSYKINTLIISTFKHMFVSITDGYSFTFAIRLMCLDPLPMFLKLLGFKVELFVITYSMEAQWTRLNMTMP